MCDPEDDREGGNPLPESLSTADSGFSSELLNQLLEQLAQAPQHSIQALPALATPNDAYNVFLEMVRQCVPVDKQQLLVQARGLGDTLESALAIDYVYSLAMEELRAMLRLPPLGD
jgi:hypothetical protein